MISETFMDEYGTQIIVRKNPAHDHVQLLLVYADNSEPTSYGFTLDSFSLFAASCVKIENAIEEATEHA